MKQNAALRRRSFLKSLGPVVPVAAARPDFAFSQTQTASPAPSGGKQAAAKEMAADLVTMKPRELRKQGELFKSFQNLLADRGVPLA